MSGARWGWKGTHEATAVRSVKPLALPRRLRVVERWASFDPHQVAEPPAGLADVTAVRAQPAEAELAGHPEA
jgi:hypothetical protein